MKRGKKRKRWSGGGKEIKIVEKFLEYFIIDGTRARAKAEARARASHRILHSIINSTLTSI